MKIKYIEDRLGGDQFNQMYDGDDMTLPLEATRPSPFTNKTFVEDMEKKHRNRQANA